MTGVAVEKGTKAVISVDFSVCGERTFNNLRANFAGEIPRKEFFNTHARFRQRSIYVVRVTTQLRPFVAILAGHHACAPRLRSPRPTARRTSSYWKRRS